MTGAAPPGFTARAARPGDLPAVLAAIHAYEQRFIGAPTTSAADLEEEWATADLAADSLVLEAPDGSLVAYGLLAVSADEAYTDGYVDPAWAGRGAGRALVRGLVARAQGRAPRLRTGCATNDPAAAELFASEGLAFARRFARMEIRLGDGPPPAAAPLPAGVALRAFRPGEEAEFHAVTDAAFRGSWGWHEEPLAEWLVTVRAKQAYDPALWLVAEEGDRLVAAARCLPQRFGAGWVRTLAVLPEARGRGLGRALLLHAFATFHARGERVVGLGVDTANDTGALALYESAGMRVVESSDVWEQPLLEAPADTPAEAPGVPSERVAPGVRPPRD